MSIRVRLIAFMLLAACVPLFLYVALAVFELRNDSRQTIERSTTSTFEESVTVFEQSIDRLTNTPISIAGNSETSLLYNHLRQSRDSSELSLMRKSEIRNNKSVVNSLLKAHYMAQQDILYGISLTFGENPYASLYVGSDTVNADIVRRAMDNVGKAPLYAWFDAAGVRHVALCMAMYGLYDNDVLGVCVLNVNAERLFSAFAPPGGLPSPDAYDGEHGAESQTGDEHRLAFVLDENGRVLYHSNPELIGFPFVDREIVAKAETALDGGQTSGGVDVGGMEVYSYTALDDGINYQVACRRLDINGSGDGSRYWTAYSATPYSYITQSSQTVTSVLLPALILAAGLALALALVFSQSVYKPILSVTRQISRMGETNMRIAKRSRQPYEVDMLIDSFNALMANIEKLMARVEAEANGAAQAKILTLRAQISPHFLYNTLNIIKCMAASGETERIPECVDSLIGLLRASLGSNSDLASLGQELENVDYYLCLQRMRLDLRFEYVVNVPDELRSRAIAHFTLQPIVENALLHAFSAVENDSNTIEVAASVHDGTLEVSVRDNGDGLDPDKCDELNSQFHAPVYKLNRVGLHNVIARNRYLLGDASELTIVNGERGTIVTLRVPDTVYDPTMARSRDDA